MSEKIHFDGLVRKQSFELENLLSQHHFANSVRRRIRLVDAIAPIVEDSTRYAELSCECNNIPARIHPLDSLLSKFFAVPLPLLLLHFATPFLQSVHHNFVSLQGFTPVHEKRSVRADGIFLSLLQSGRKWWT
jgi:hypothetical protein